MTAIKSLITTFFHSQSRISWRRLAVLTLGTVLLMVSAIDSTQWLYLGLAYIAGDSAEKAMAALSRK